MVKKLSKVKNGIPGENFDKLHIQKSRGGNLGILIYGYARAKISIRTHPYGG